jgi:diguanylate cyclase (GGDEF)-like protein
MDAGVAEVGREDVASPSWDGPQAVLLASMDELEAVSRFAVDGVAAWARQLAEDADGLQLPEVRLRAELIEADLWRRQGKLADAARVAQRVRRWATDNGSRHVQARSAYLLAAVMQELGDAAMALEMAVTAVDLVDDTAPAALRIDHLVRLADCLGLQGDRSASERYAAVLELARDLGDAEREVLVLNNWAYSEALAGQHEEALRISEQLQARSAQHGMPLTVGSLDTIARALMGAQRPAEAVALLEQGLRPGAVEESADGDAGADFLLTLAEAHRLLGRFQDAQRHLDDCVDRCEAIGLTAIRVRARREQAELHAALGNWRAAYEEHKRYSDGLAELQSAQRDARARAMHAMYEATEARRQSRRYRELSLRDPLTGLYNRRHVDTELPRLLSERAGALTVAMVDLDHFKRVNDTCSHEVGDHVLRVVGDLLRAAVPGGPRAAGSFAARMGGEEFLLVLVGEDGEGARDRLESLRRAVRSHPWSPLTGRVPVTVSIGATSLGDRETLPLSELLSRADAHLYRAKRQGRDRVEADVLPLGGAPLPRQ